MRVKSSLGPLFVVGALIVVGANSCTKTTEGDMSGLPDLTIDDDGDRIPDVTEDRNRNGQIDPGETDPTSDDTDGDGIADGDEVETIACTPVMDRPFRVYDAPGAGSMMLVDEQVREHAILRTSDNRAPAIALADPIADVAAVVVQKRPSMGVSTPSEQREIERRAAIRALGRVSNQQTRAIMTVEGFPAEIATFDVDAMMPMDAKTAVARMGSALLNSVPLTGNLPAGGQVGTKLTVHMLTVLRSRTRAAIVAAVAVGETLSEAQELRLDEFTDGTNLARHKSFTRHVCDPFVAKAEAKADILFVVDDSGSMEDDQMAVRAAADAMDSVLSSAQIDYRLGVASMRAENQNDIRRGWLAGGGLTPDVNTFKRRIVVGADGGWEPGLETGIKALDRLLPRTPEGVPPEEDKLREGAATIVIHVSDERDQAVECAACGSCQAAEGEPRMCTAPAGQSVVDNFVQEYQSRGAVTFALVGDIPNGCQQTGNRDDFEPGQGYVEVAQATGGQFGSLCGDMETNLRDVARVASGVASTYRLTERPASATLRVAIGQPGQGRALVRSRTNGFDYDPVQNSVIFYGDAQPVDGDEVVIGYRRWDWANNPATPADPCDECSEDQACRPELDIADCQTICGDVICEPGLVCFETTGECGDPSNRPIPPNEACGECDAGLICDENREQCVPPCETTGCNEGEICNSFTHLCEFPGL